MLARRASLPPSRRLHGRLQSVTHWSPCSPAGPPPWSGAARVQSCPMAAEPPKRRACGGHQ
eukprot:6846179-Alexandrium_andersonii.AAC.1